MKMVQDTFDFMQYLLEDKEKEAIKFIQEHEPPEGYFVGFSGGKDSIVVYDLVKRANVKYEVYHSCTFIDHREIYKFIKEHYAEVKWLFPKNSFWKQMLKAAPPTMIRRWCCDFLKKDSSAKHPLKKRIMGIRAEESSKRAKRGRISEYNKTTTYKPIFSWKEFEIWDYIEKHKLPYPKLYDEGEKRVGCIMCPFNQKSMQQDTPFSRLYKKVARDWFENYRTEASKEKYKDQSFEEFWSWYISGKSLPEKQDSGLFLLMKKLEEDVS